MYAYPLILIDAMLICREKKTSKTGEEWIKGHLSRENKRWGPGHVVFASKNEMAVYEGSSAKDEDNCLTFHRCH